MDSTAATKTEQPILDDLQEGRVSGRLFGCKLSYLTEFLMVLVVFFGRFLYYGWKYFPQLDDYIQYHNYTEYYHLRMSDLWDYVADFLGLFTARPLAAFGDIYIISNFFSSMIVVVLALSVMYAATALILRYIFNKLFGTGYFFTAVFCLLPISFEGLYWVSASSRIIPSLFFAAIAALCMLRVVETGRIRYAFLFTVAQILSFGYYEQITVLSIALAVMIAIIKRNKYSITALLVLANILLYALYSQIAGMLWDGGIYASRSEVALPFITKDYFSTVFPSATGQILQASGGFMPVANMRALWRGIKIIFADHAYIYLIALLAVTALTAFLLWKKGDEEQPDKRRAIAAVLWGVFLALAPLAPFYILKSSWIGIRAIVPSLCGCALILDTLFRLITRGKRIVTVPIISFVVLIACIASVSELHDYRATTEYDHATAYQVINGIEDLLMSNDIDENTNIAIFDIGASSLEGQNYKHHEHVSSSTGSVWSFTGILRCLSGDGNFPNVTAMPVDENGYFYYAAHGNSYRIENYDYVMIAKDGKLVEVTPVRGFTESDFDESLTGSVNYESYLLYSNDIVRMARIAEYSDHGTIEFYW